MATKTVQVIIDGKETVSAAASTATGGLEGFTSKVQGWVGKIALLGVAYQSVKAAIGTVIDFTKDAIVAYDAYTASNTRLSAQSKLTGISIEDLKENAKKARQEFGLSTTVANDAAVTVGKYAARAGDASQQNELLAAALDLGAAAGLTAADSMLALEQGLRGQDEGFDKLLGKNPSQLWKDYADANGLAVGKMTDTQKRMAELTAIVEAGNIVQGTYNERMETGAGQQDKLNNRMEQAKIAFGAAIQPMRILITQGLIKLVEWGTPVVETIGEIVNVVGLTLVGSFRLAKSAVGTLVEAIGWLTRSKDMQEWGKKASQSFAEYVTDITKVSGANDKAASTATNAGKAHQLAAVQIVASAETSSEASVRAVNKTSAAIDAKLGPALKTTIGMTEGAIRSLGEAAADQLPPETMSKFEADMRKIAAHAREVEDRITGAAPPLDKNAKNAKKMADEIAMVARGALDTASAFGVIDDKAASALNSAINIAAAIGSIAGGNMFAGVAGLLGGVANIVSTMMSGDKERKALTKANTTQLERLTKEVGNLSLNVTGETFGGVQGALESLAGRGALRATSIGRELLGRGLGMGDLDRVADALGITIRDKNGRPTDEGLAQLLAAMQNTEIGQFGQDFSSQLDSTKAGFDVFGTDTAGQASAFGNLFGKFSPALAGVFDANDLGGSKTRLQGLFSRLQNGGVSAQELGGMTGTQFLDAITTLLGLIDTMGGEGGGSSGGGFGGGGLDIGGGSVGVPGPAPKTLADVVAGIGTQTEALGAYHVASLDLMSRTAEATEMTAANTGDALPLLRRIAAAVGGGAVSNQLAAERFRAGDVSL